MLPVQLFTVLTLSTQQKLSNWWNLNLLMKNLLKTFLFVPSEEYCFLFVESYTV